MDPAHVRHHAVHGHITRHDRFQGAIFFHRHGEGHHQFPGSCVDIRRSHNRTVGADHLLIPRTNGRIIIRRYTGRLGEFRRFAGVAHIDVSEPTRLGKLFKHRNRIVTQRHAPGGGDRGHLAFDPVGNRHIMAGAGAGQDIALRLLVILARDLEVDNRIEEKGDDQAACRRGNNASTNRSEHK